MRRRVPVMERCLVYLLDRTEVQEGDPRAEELVQDNVAEGIRERRDAVSRAMSHLRQRGFVKTAKVHVRNRPRRKLAYFLTEDGFRHAVELRRKLEEMRVVLIDLEGRESRHALYEIPSLLSRRLKFSDILAGVETGRLDSRTLLDWQSRLRGGRLHDVKEAIATPHFRGREEILSRLDAFLDDEQSRAFLLLGLPGIGKTALGSQWVGKLKGSMHIVWRRLRPETTLSYLLRDLATVLHAFGFPALLERLQWSKESPRPELFNILRRDLSQMRILLVFDDMHAAQSDVAELVVSLLGMESGPSKPKMLLLARGSVPSLRAESVVRGKVWEETLGDLSRREAEQVLAAIGVEKDRQDLILDKCGGHPLSLEMAATRAVPVDAVRHVSVSWFAQELLSQLGSRTRKAIALAAVFGESIEASLLGVHSQELLRLCLLRRIGGDRVDVHEIVREAVVQSSPPELIIQAHLQAGRILAESRNPHDVVSAIRHYSAGEAHREATELLVDRGEDIIGAGLAESILPLVNQSLQVPEKGRPESRLLLLRGHALFALGRWAEAAAAYGRCHGAGDERVAAEAQLGQGKAEMQRGVQSSLPHLVEARRQLEKLGILGLLGEVHYWIGGVNEDAGRLEEAREAYEKGRAIAFDAGDRRWEGLCLYGIGRIRSLLRDYPGAVDEEKEALRLLERAGHRLEVAKVCAGLGGNLLELGRFDEAESYLVRATGETRATGASGILAACLYNLASLKVDVGRLMEATPLFEEASEVFEDQGKFEMAARCAAGLAFCYWSQGDGTRGDERAARAERLISNIAQPALRCQSLRYLAYAESRTGRSGKARQHLTEAIAQSRAANLRGLEAELTEELGRLS